MRSIGQGRYAFLLGNALFKGGTHVMAILNATPDSFFEGSRATGVYDAVSRAGRALLDGAAVIDVGGQSTRPGATLVTKEEEMRRVVPVVETVKAQYKDALVSVDTFYGDVARECLKVGADMINDVGFLADESLLRATLDANAALLVMHNRRGSTLPDLFEDKTEGLRAAVKKLQKFGFSKEKILLDGGVGFNLSREEDISLMRGYGRLVDEFEEPFVLGTSRKSFLGGRVEDRLQATLETTKEAKKLGVLFVRVHDVKQNVDALNDL